MIIPCGRGMVSLAQGLLVTALVGLCIGPLLSVFMALAGFVLLLFLIGGGLKLLFK